MISVRRLNAVNRMDARIWYFSCCCCNPRVGDFKNDFWVFWGTQVLVRFRCAWLSLIWFSVWISFALYEISTWFPSGHLLLIFLALRLATCIRVFVFVCICVCVCGSFAALHPHRCWHLPPTTAASRPHPNQHPHPHTHRHSHSHTHVMHVPVPPVSCPSMCVCMCICLLIWLSSYQESGLDGKRVLAGKKYIQKRAERPDYWLPVDLLLVCLNKPINILKLLMLYTQCLRSS